MGATEVNLPHIALAGVLCGIATQGIAAVVRRKQDQWPVSSVVHFLSCSALAAQGSAIAYDLLQNSSPSTCSFVCALRWSIVGWVLSTRLLVSFVAWAPHAASVAVPSAILLGYYGCEILQRSANWVDVGVGLGTVALQFGVVCGILGCRWLFVNDVHSLFRSIPERKDEAVNETAVSNTIPLRPELSPEQCEADMRCCWVMGNIVRTLLRIWGKHCFFLAVVKIISDGLGFVTPILLRVLVDEFASPHQDVHKSCVILSCIVGASLLSSLLRSHYDLNLRKIALHCRALLSIAICEHVTELPKFLASGFSSGDVTNYLAVDTARFTDQIPNLNDLWALPLQVCITLYLLYVQVDFAFFTGFGITIALIPLNWFLAKKIGTVNVEMMRNNDDRVLRISEVLNNFKYVKMCGWSRQILPWVLEPRVSYMKCLRWVKLLDAWCVFFWATTPVFVSLATFATYVWLGNVLTPGRAIAALALFNNLILPLNAYPWVVNGAVEMNVSRHRISRFLEKFDPTASAPTAMEDGGDVKMAFDDFDDTQQGQQSDESSAIRKSVPTVQDAGVRVVTATDLRLVHLAAAADIQSFVLSVPHFSASAAQLVGVVGKPGSGKSSFVSAIAGECRIDAGSLQVRSRKTAFVPQTPFLFNGSLRANILFGMPFASAKYDAVIQATALDVDVAQLESGDKTVVGERGCHLSGGQRSRVAVARAVYSEADCYLFDDPLSSLDPVISKHLAEHVVEELVTQGKCVVLATHSLGALRKASAVYVADEGTLRPIDETEVVVLRDEIFEIPTALHERQECAAAKGCAAPADDVVARCSSDDPSEAASRNAIEDEMRLGDHGSLSTHTVMGYARSVGLALCFFVLLFIVCMQAAKNYSDFYIARTVEGSSFDQNRFLYMLGVIAVVNALFAILRAFTFAIAGLRAAKVVHDDLLNAIVASCYSFFASFPAGALINRFTRDAYNVDDPLPFTVNIVLAQFFLLVGSVVVICITTSWEILIMFFPVFGLYYLLQKPYRRVNREVKRLESASRSPVIDALRILYDGGPVIRAFGVHCKKHFVCEAFVALTAFQRIVQNQILLVAWFGMRLQFIGCVATAAIGTLAIALRTSSKGQSSAGTIGLALAYTGPLTSYLSGLLSSYTESEKMMISVERMKLYTDMADAAKEVRQRDVSISEELPIAMSANWPLYGNVKFDAVSMKYVGGFFTGECDVNNYPIVLKEISFEVCSGERIAIVGRTGSGKSSLLNAMLGLCPLMSGSIQIDGISISSLDADYLRSRIAVLPQEPFLFQGTMRDNVDPFHSCTDEEVTIALLRVGMGSYGLDCDVAEEGGNFSAGQRHLVMLARLFLRHSSLVILDEPSANIDNETDEMMQRAIAELFRGRTAIVVTHKLKDIEQFDKVLVLDSGAVVQFDAPHVLLTDLERRSVLADLVASSM